MWACAVCRRAEDEADPRCGACGSRRRIDPTARVLASPWGRREAFHNASSSDVSGAVQDEADAQLWAARPRLSFEGEIIETPVFRYGVEFSLGTLLTADTRGFSFECRMSNIHISLGRDGGESIEIKVSQETVI